MTPARARSEQRGPLRTVSLRRRVTAVVTGVVALVVLLLGITVDQTFALQTDRSLGTLLDGRAQLGRQLARNGVGPQQIVNRVGVSGVDATLTLRNGTVYGDPLPTPASPRTVSTRLGGTGRVRGATLVLTADTDLTRTAAATLRRILLLAGLGAVLLSALLVALATRYALAPLATMAGLARRIADGRRGSRLAPTRPDTELGRTASAFDDMLDELEGAEARAVRSEAATRAFLADAAHELRTPVTGISAAAETLLHHPELTDADREQLEVLLVREARRAGTLISDLLTAARLDAGAELRRVPVDLLDLAEDERDRLALTAPGVTVQVSGQAPQLALDPEKVTSVLRNLVDNAVRAAGPEGRVEIRLAAASGAGAEVLVLDSGPGVPVEERERIFERLVRLDRDRGRDSGGSGLGLAIARGWAQAHSGTLTCVGPPPGVPGAAFLLRLPSLPVPAEHRALP
ncbi:ATP-binding protein [uncultured Friedmanniella sp.]|uniref:HAMP domain-containing sensor histidine kinase n=1 Tax=uncultured Friedmanniella sp. TaxID=335381 RepID=UPI0035CC747E